MKKIIIIPLLLSVLLVTSCSSNSKDSSDIVVSSYAIEFITKTIVGDLKTVENIIPENTDAHDFEPSQKSILQANDADLVMFVSKNYDPGLSSVDGSVEILLELNTESDNPHFWTSPQELIIASEVIYDLLINTYPDDSEEFKKNYENLESSLKELDLSYTEQLVNTDLDTFVISHNSFEYLNDYNIQSLPLSGSDHDHEISQNQLIDVIDFINSNNVEYIATETGISCSTCETLEVETNVATLEINPLESKPSSGDLISELNNNLEILLKLLTTKN